MLNVSFKNSMNVMRRSNMIDKNFQIINKVRDEPVRNTGESSSANDQIFEYMTADDNLLNSKIQNIHTINKFNT